MPLTGEHSRRTMDIKATISKKDAMKLPLKDQRGIGHLGVILVLVVVGVGAMGWWVVVKSGDNGAEKALQAAIKNAHCDYDDSDICKFFASWKAQQYYTVESTLKGKTNSTSIVQAEGTKKSHMTLKGETSYETIVIDNTLYTKAANGTWWKQSLNSTDSTNYSDNTSSKLPEPSAEDSAKVTYKKMGKETCGQYNCFKYQVVNASDAQSNTYIWFDDHDYQLRRTQTINNDGTEYDATFSYEKVHISEPSPVKELQPGQYLVPGQSEPSSTPSVGNLQDIQKLMDQYQNAN
jgi:hypothetical protein